MIRKVKASEVPKRTRRRIPRFEKTAEWAALKAAFDEGLKPGDAWEIVLNEEDKKKYKIKNRRTVVRFVRNYVSAHKLSYLVKSFTRDASIFIIVQHPQKFTLGRRSQKPRGVH